MWCDLRRYLSFLHTHFSSLWHSQDLLTQEKMVASPSGSPSCSPYNSPGSLSSVNLIATSPSIPRHTPHAPVTPNLVFLLTHLQDLMPFHGSTSHPPLQTHALHQSPAPIRPYLNFQSCDGQRRWRQSTMGWWKWLPSPSFPLAITQLPPSVHSGPKSTARRCYQREFWQMHLKQGNCTELKIDGNKLFIVLFLFITFFFSEMRHSKISFKQENFLWICPLPLLGWEERGLFFFLREEKKYEVHWRGKKKKVSW